MTKHIVSLIALAATTFIAATGCDNEARPLGDNGDSHGSNTPPGECPAGGTYCSGEGSQCGTLRCHCGTWIDVSNPACGLTCTQPQPNGTCADGSVCSGEGNTCADGKVCHCGRWLSAAASSLQCPGTGNPGDGGSGGSGGSPGSGGSGGSGNTGNTGGMSGGPTNATLTVTIMSSYAHHIYCQGGTVDLASLYKSDTQAQWVKPFDVSGWGCDSFNGYFTCSYHFDSSVERPRYQCYLDEAGGGTASSPDMLRYTCAKHNMLKSGESFDPSMGYHTVTNLDPDSLGENCQTE